MPYVHPADAAIDRQRGYFVTATGIFLINGNIILFSEREKKRGENTVILG